MGEATITGAVVGLLQAADAVRSVEAEAKGILHTFDWVSAGVLFTTVITALTGMFVALGKIWLDLRAQRKEIIAGNKQTEEVRRATQEVHDQTTAVRAETKEVRVLVDGRMTAAMANIARLTKAVARLTNDPEDILAAEIAAADLVDKRAKDKEAGIVPLGGMQRHVDQEKP